MPIKSEIKIYNIGSLFSDNDDYQIPIYQRNYAWGEIEISQLIQDIIDSAKDSNTEQYYIGTLVVAKSKLNGSTYMTIDGQQRLTTLTILISAIRNEYNNVDLDFSWYDKLKLSFSNRKKSDYTLKNIFINESLDNSEMVNIGIYNGYKDCCKILKQKLDEYKMPITTFLEYLQNHVNILRVPLPNDTELNHYFEIMNSRGEQLEKHEVLKAELMNVFNSIENKEIVKQFHHTFHVIWEACSDMERYIQYGFDIKKYRSEIFGNDWDKLMPIDFEKLNELVTQGNNKITIEEKKELLEMSLTDIVDYYKPTSKSNKDNIDGKIDRFTSVINFQNFLLHCLNVLLENEDIVLDDKKLIISFNAELKKRDDVDKIEFVKEFLFHLLKCRFLFDKFVVKRDLSQEVWSLFKLQKYKDNQANYVRTFSTESSGMSISDNNRALLLMTMFHVSTSTQVYKHWLSHILNYLINHSVISASHYISFLLHTAKRFIYNSYISNDSKEPGQLSITDTTLYKQDIDWNKLTYKNTQHNLVFNYIDYLLLDKYHTIFTDLIQFNYSFRSSVEHFYPQNPDESILEKLDGEYLHCIGNLCLISHSKNSAYSNWPPKVKAQVFVKGDYESVQLRVMIEKMKEASNWSTIEIEKHRDEIFSLLIQNQISEFKEENLKGIGYKWYEEFRNSNPILLAQLLFCIDDYSTNIIGNKYNYLQFEDSRATIAVGKLNDLCIQRSIKKPIQLINETLAKGQKIDYTYLLIVYEKALEFCSEGNYYWIEDEETKHSMVTLLTGQIISNRSRDLLLYCLALSFKLNLEGLYFFYDNKLYLNITLTENGYKLTEQKGADLELSIWNSSGKEIHCNLEVLSHKNSNSFKQLNNEIWLFNEDGTLEYRGKSKILNLSINYIENLEALRNKMITILKKGFQIKLS